MSPKRKSKLSAATRRTKLRAATGATCESAAQRMRRWWHRGFRKKSFSVVYGVFLLIPAWVLAKTFFQAFSQAASQSAFRESDEFWFFGLGVVIWTLAFFGGIWANGAPWSLHLYVFGHELTHAVWVWLWRGKVYEKKMWASDGGYIVTDKHNFWIALAPYFYPVYSLVVIVLYGIAGLFFDVTGSSITLLLMTPLQWLFLLLGLTWAFHFSFTIWMIPKGQTDITAHGSFFSFVVIYIMNMLVLAIFLILTAPHVTFASFGRGLLENAEDFSEAAWPVLRSAWMKLAR